MNRNANEAGTFNHFLLLLIKKILPSPTPLNSLLVREITNERKQQEITTITPKTSNHIKLKPSSEPGDEKPWNDMGQLTARSDL